MKKTVVMWVREDITRLLCLSLGRVAIILLSRMTMRSMGLNGYKNDGIKISMGQVNAGS